MFFLTFISIDTICVGRWYSCWIINFLWISETVFRSSMFPKLTIGTIVNSANIITLVPSRVFLLGNRDCISRICSHRWLRVGPIILRRWVRSWVFLQESISFCGFAEFPFCWRVAINASGIMLAGTRNIIVSNINKWGYESIVLYSFWKCQNIWDLLRRIRFGSLILLCLGLDVSIIIILIF